MTDDAERDALRRRARDIRIRSTLLAALGTVLGVAVRLLVTLSR